MLKVILCSLCVIKCIDGGTINTNLEVNVLSYLGDNSEQFDPKFVAVLNNKTIIVAGLGRYGFNSLLPQLLFNANNDTLPTLIAFRKNGNTFDVKAVAKFGFGVLNDFSDMCTNNKDTIAISGFGGIGSFTYDTRNNMFYEIGYFSNAGINVKCDMGKDGTMIVFVDAYWLKFTVFNKTLGIISQRDKDITVNWGNNGNSGIITDVAIDTDNKLAFFAGWIQIFSQKFGNFYTPGLIGYDYINNSITYKLYDWSRSSLENTGDISSSYIDTITVSNDELWVLGHTEGNSSVFRKSPMNILEELDKLNVNDNTGYTGNKMGTQLQWIGRFNVRNGDPIYGQFMNVRNITGGEGSIEPIAISVADDGDRVFIAHNIGCCMEKYNELTVNNIPVDGYGGGLAIMSKDFTKRYHWTSFTDSMSSINVEARDVSYNDDILVYIGVVDGDSSIIEINPIPGTSMGNLTQTGFIMIKEFNETESPTMNPTESPTQSNSVNINIYYTFYLIFVFVLYQ